MLRLQQLLAGRSPIGDSIKQPVHWSSFRVSLRPLQRTGNGCVPALMPDISIQHSEVCTVKTQESTVECQLSLTLTIHSRFEITSCNKHRLPQPNFARHSRGCTLTSVDIQHAACYPFSKHAPATLLSRMPPICLVEENLPKLS